jgi:hypothetical protein
VDQSTKFVEIHDVIRNHVDGDAHVFVAFHGSSKVKIFEVREYHLGTVSGQDTVDEDFGSGDVGSFGANIARVFDLVTATRPVHTMRILLFGSVGGDDIEIGDFASFAHFLAVNKEQGVGAFDAGVNFSKTLD